MDFIMKINRQKNTLFRNKAFKGQDVHLPFHLHPWYLR